MKVRVIAGRFGGRILDAPDGRTTHPMGERIRGALFNSLSDRVKGARVLDAFAGTGAVGIEALSRGARHVTFVDQDKLAFKILGNNLALVGAEERATTSHAALGAWVKTYRGEPFDIIIADPPYNKPQEELVEKFFRFLKPDGLLIVSHATNREIRLVGGEYVESRAYGDATLSSYNKPDLMS